MSDNKKIIICGTGRAGTSFLMLLLTRLGYDTGYHPYKEPFDKSTGCGLEIAGLDLSLDVSQVRELLRKSPRIIKSPQFSVYLHRVIDNNIAKIDHVIIPVRNLHDAALSRVKNGLHWGVFKQKDWACDSAIKTSSEEQYFILNNVLSKLIEAVTLYDISFTTIAFPRMLGDEKYLLEKLQHVFPSIDKDTFSNVFERTVFKKP